MKKNQKVNSHTTQDIETEAEKVLKMGIDLFNEFGYPTSAVFFYGPNGTFTIDDFKFNYKSNPNGAKHLRKVADEVNANMVITLRCAKLHDANKYFRDKSGSTKKAIFVYAEDKNTNYTIAQEFEPGRNGRIQLLKKIVFSKGDFVGRLTGFVNTKLRFENEARTNRSLLSSGS